MTVELIRDGNRVGFALTIDAIVQLAESAAAAREAAHASGIGRAQGDTRAAAIGLLLLSELGAVGFNGDGDLPPNVEIGEDLADGKARVASYETLLARLGWKRDTAYWHRDCDPLGLVYTR